MISENLGTFELTETVPVYFQFVDNTFQFANPAAVPEWRIYDAAGAEVTSSGTALSTAVFTGQYFANIDLDNYDGAAATLSTGRYLIKITSTTAGALNHTGYYIEVVPAGEKQTAANSNVKDLHDDLHAEIVAAGDMATLVEGGVWDSDVADHTAAGTFGSGSLDDTTLGYVYAALSVDPGSGITAGDDLGTIKAKIDTIEAVGVGRWKLDTTAKTMTLYELDGTTPLVVFNLTDPVGDPSTTNVGERVPQ